MRAKWSKQKSLTLICLAALGVIFVLSPITIGMLFWLGDSASSVQTFLVLLLLSILVAAVFYVLLGHSEALVSGSLCGINFEVLGPVAAALAFLVVTVGALNLMPASGTRTVRIVLLYDEQQLATRFTITPTLPGQDIGPRESINNVVTVELPVGITEIPLLALACNGYRLSDPPPFAIKNNLVQLNVSKTSPPPPRRPTAYPDPRSLFNDFPSLNSIVQVPKFSAVDVTFFYRNITSKDLRLLVLDCSHYLSDTAAPGSAWLDWPLPPGDEYQQFDRFERLGETTGWFCFAVEDQSGNAYPLKCINVFANPTPRMTIFEHPDGGYELQLDE